MKALSFFPGIQTSRVLDLLKEIKDCRKIVFFIFLRLQMFSLSISIEFFNFYKSGLKVSLRLCNLASTF